VLVCGEEGTGRRVVARAIHAAQPASGPFVCVDFAAHDADRVEQELFGATAFFQNADGPTGLERVGAASLLRSAHGGTLYLQSIGEAPARVQARLARVLRDREAVEVGTRETLALDVRPIAGVEPSIDDMVREGRVRGDLVRRLSTVRIDVPALRNRREDIPALANFFVREICAERRITPRALSRSALLLIGALPWHGNAVELRALLGAVVGAQGSDRSIDLEDLLEHVCLDRGPSVVGSGGGTLRQARTRFEREYIASILEQHNGCISEAAKTLGIQRTNLYRKMRALRVNRTSRT
jgi:two-component system nitrogen regulation response regulator NtrX